VPLQLLVSESTAIAALDAQLDTGFQTGAEYPASTPQVPKLDGYDKPMLIGTVDQAAIFKPKIRSPFKMLVAAMMKAVQIWVTPVLQNGWLVYDVANFTSPGYYRDFMGRCHLRGLVKSGTLPGTIFTLPAGYRPTKTHIFATISNDLLGQIRVQADGQVVATGGSNTWISLDGVSFRAEQ
jgi:hypothetical protein